MIPITAAPRWTPAADAAAAALATPVDRRHAATPAPGAPLVTAAGLRDRRGDGDGPPPRREPRTPVFAGGAPDPTGNAGRRLDLFA